MIDTSLLNPIIAERIAVQGDLGVRIELHALVPAVWAPNIAVDNASFDHYHLTEESTDVPIQTPLPERLDFVFLCPHTVMPMLEANRQWRLIYFFLN